MTKEKTNLIKTLKDENLRAETHKYTQNLLNNHKNRSHTVPIKNNNKNEIVVGPIDKKAKLTVEFLFNPEYISIGQKIIINDQSLKAYGVITKIFK